MRLATPNELKEITIRDYMRDAARAGRSMSIGEAERRALVDCQIYDAVTREQRTAIAPSAPDPAKVAEKAAVLDAEAAKVGAEVNHGQVQTRRAPVATLHKRHRKDSRAAFMKGRINRILQGTTPSKDFKVACSTAECPALAYEVMTMYANLVTRGMPRRAKDEPNPFAGMNERDASRMSMAILENICDRSSGQLGPWWVPK